MKQLSRYIIMAMLGSNLSILPAIAQDATVPYPNAPVNFIVGFSPGGGTDTVARITSEALGSQWSRSTVVNNSPGAGGAIAAALAARAQADGYTLLFDSASFTLRPALSDDLPFDVEKDFEPVSLVASAPYVLVANPNVDASTVQELIDLAKTKPGELTYASAGIGSALHFAGELFKSLAGIDLRHVPYQGAAGIPDLLAGRVNVAFAGLPQSLPHIKSGALRPLAVTTVERSDQLPDVPTMQEAGVAGYEMESWYGLFAPAGTPQPILEKIATDVAAAARDSPVQQKFASQGLIARGISSESFKSYIEAELSRWKQVVEEAGITPE